MEATAAPTKFDTLGGGRPDREPEAPFKPQPNSVEETGLPFGQLLDLLIKTIYYAGRPSARDVCESMCLPFSVVETLLSFLKREQLIEVVGSNGLGEQQYQYSLTEKGNERAVEAVERSQYLGPAPVPYADYLKVIHEQSVRNVRVDATAVKAALGDLVLSEVTRNLVGPAVNSGRSMLLYGDPGNGKSSIAKGIGKMLRGNILVPHAVDVNGQTVRVFDPRVHTVVDEENFADRRSVSMPVRQERRRDARYMLCKRPLIMTGGELTLADLELRYSPQSKFYIAPVQMKANCGILVIDDFGRQMVSPKELLNRWIVPMEARVDYLSLLSGETMEVPFELLLVFSTNIPPGQLGDEAFFRRIRHKIEVLDPTEDGFLQIMEKICALNKIPYHDDAGRYIIERYYRPKGRHLRGVHPRDLMDLLMDIATFRGVEPVCSQELLDLACSSYFIEDRVADFKAA